MPVVIVVPATRRLEVRSAVAAVRTMAKSSYAAGAIDAAGATMHWQLEWHRDWQQNAAAFIHLVGCITDNSLEPEVLAACPGRFLRYA